MKGLVFVQGILGQFLNQGQKPKGQFHMKTSKLRWVRQTIVFFVIAAMAIALFPFAGLKTVTKAADGDETPQVFVPAHDKTIKDNGDGTYELELSVTGSAETKELPKAKVNVLVIFDVSSSMYNNNATNPKGSYGYYRNGYRQLYKLVGDDDYVAITDAEEYEGTVYQQNSSGGPRPTYTYAAYEGDRYYSNVDRAHAAEKAMYDFTDALFKYQDPDNPTNIQMAFVQFSSLANTKTIGQIQNPEEDWIWTSDKAKIVGTSDAPRLASDYYGDRYLNYASNTNWEAALDKGLDVIKTADNDPTFVLFVTDGAPYHYVDDDDGEEKSDNNNENNYKEATSSAGAIAAYKTGDEDVPDDKKGDVSFFGIYAFGREADYLDDLVYYALNGEERENVSSATDKTDVSGNYFNAGSTKELTDAIATIFGKIVEALGITEVTIADGTTEEVELSSGGSLLDVDDGSFKYWLEVPVENNKFTRKDLVSGENIEYEVTDNGNGTLTIKWTKNGTPDQVTLDGTMNSMKTAFKYEWKRNYTGDDSFYDKEPPAATLDDGTVNWNLKSVGTLLDGVTYSITFDVWPSQETLDLMADIDNGVVDYDKLDQSVKDYLSKDGKLQTNTTTALNYSDTRRDPSDAPAVPFPVRDPVDTEVSKMNVIKVWYNDLDERGEHQYEEGFNMAVTRDGKQVDEVTVSKANNWTDQSFISVGIMRVSKDASGNITGIRVLEPGHDYSIQEPSNLTYHWELVIETIHPMLINGELITLVQVLDEDIPAAMKDEDGNIVKDFYTLEGVNFYVIPDKNDTKKVYKEKEVPEEPVTEDTSNDQTADDPDATDDSKEEELVTASVSAYNERKSVLDVRKEIDGDAPAGVLFTYTISLDDPTIEVPDEDREDLWFSVQTGTDDEGNSILNYDLDTTAKAEKSLLGYSWDSENETYVVNSKVTDIVYDAEAGTITYKYSGTEYTVPYADKTNIQVGENTVSAYEYFTGYYSVADKESFTVKLEEGWNLRFINLPTGTTYSVEESATMDPGFKFESVDGETEFTVGALPDGAVDLGGGKYTYNGIEYTLTVKDDKEYYTAKYDPVTDPKNPAVNGEVISPNAAFEVIYTNEYPRTFLTVNKVWNGTKQESVPITLFENGDETETTQELNADNSWTYTFANMDIVDSDGNIINYSAKETPFEGYNTTYEGTTDVVVNVSGATADTEITVTVGEQTATATTTADGTATVTVEGVAFIDEKGELIEDLSAKSTNGTAEIAALTNRIITITNTELNKISITKVWKDASNQDGKRPTTDEYKNYLALLKDGKDVTSTYTNNLKVTVDEEDSNKYSVIWSNLPMDGTYTVKEKEITGYTADKTEVADGGVITNTHETETTSISIEKVWEDGSDQDGKRPTTLKVKLSNGNEYTLEAKNNWKLTVTGLPKYAAGQEIKYTWTEDETQLPAGYKLISNKTDGSKTVITNGYTPETIESISVQKVWDDNDNEDAIEPESVTIQLLADGTPVEGKTLTLKASETEAENWKGAFKDLPKNKAGKAITYTVEEVKTTVITGEDTATTYAITIDGDATKGFTVTNTHTPVEKFGDLIIEKFLQSFNGDSEKVMFVFHVTAKVDGAEKPVYDDYVGLEFTEAGSKKAEIIGKIPVGAVVTVVEENTAGYESVGETTATATILDPKDEGAPAKVTFTNKYNGSGGENTDGIVNKYSKDGTGWKVDNKSGDNSPTPEKQ